MDVKYRNANVRCHCHCGYVSVIDGPLLSRYFLVHRWDDRLVAVADHLKCTRCGQRPEFVGATGQRPTAPNRFSATEFE